MSGMGKWEKRSVVEISPSQQNRDGMGDGGMEGGRYWKVGWVWGHGASPLCNNVPKVHR